MGDDSNAGATPSLRAQRLTEAAVLVVACALVAGALRIDAPWFERHAYGFRCVRDPRLLEILSTTRLAACAAGALLVLVVRPRLGRWAGRRRWPRLSAVGRVGAAVALSLLATELVLRKPLAPPPPPPDIRYCPPGRPSPVYGYGLLPSTDYVWHAGGRDFVYAVNEEGNRARSSRTEADHEKPTLVVAGESIAMAMGLPYEESFAARLEDDLGVQVVDLGVHGYGCDQVYLRTAEVLPTYAHPVALVTLFVPEEVPRAEAEWRSRLRLGPDGALALTPPPPTWWRDLKLRELWKNAVPYHGDDEMADLRAIVRATAELARARGAYPLFVATNVEAPCIDVAGNKPWLVRTLFEDQGVPYVAVDLPRAVRIDPLEGHPNAEGHRMIAAAAAAALRAKGVF